MYHSIDYSIQYRRACTHMCIYIYICVCIYIYIYIYICILVYNINISIYYTRSYHSTSYCSAGAHRGELLDHGLEIYVMLMCVKRTKEQNKVHHNLKRNRKNNNREEL